MRRFVLALLPLCLVGVVHAAEPSAAARKLAQDALIVDTHIDAPENLIGDWNDLTVLTPRREFDYPRAVEGGLDAPWMSIFTSAEEDQQGKAWTIANLQIDAVRSLVARAPEKFALLLSPKDVEKNVGKVMLPMGMENGAPIGDDLSQLANFHARGVRYITLAHGRNNRISDSATDTAPRWGGLSPFGRQVVEEMNRVGIMVDVSHLSEDAIRQAVELSSVPVIASHSALRHFTPGFQRNLSDENVKAIAARGGVVQVPFGSMFVDAGAAKTYSDFVTAREAYRQAKLAGAAAGQPYTATEPQFPKVAPASLAAVLDNLDRVVQLTGVDHAGIGSDFDGVNGALVSELHSVADYPLLVAGLQQRGYKDADIRKILGGNLLRVWGEVERAAKP
jgi:membrane dipeptidase